MGRRAWFRACCILMFAMTLGFTGRAAYAQSAYTVSLDPVLLSPPYPSIWRSTNSLVSISFSNTAGEPILADFQITLYRGGIPVGSTPPLARTYNPGFVLYQTPQVTDWSRMSFLGEVRKSVDTTGRLPDGSYTVCADFTNVR